MRIIFNDKAEKEQKLIMNKETVIPNIKYDFFSHFWSKNIKIKIVVVPGEVIKSVCDVHIWYVNAKK